MSTVVVCDVCKRTMSKGRCSPGWSDSGVTHKIKVKFQRYNHENEGTIFPKWKSYELCHHCATRAWQFICNEKLGA